jgi:predicted signal transduction protein with EAL and GGDEF domain
MQLDIPSIMIMQVAASTLVGLVTASARDAKQVPGMNEAALASLCVAVGFSFQLLRGIVPEVLGIVVGNVGMWFGIALQVQAFRRFNEPQSTWKLPAVATACLAVVFAAMTALGATYLQRVLFTSSYFVLGMMLAIRELLAGGGVVAERSRLFCLILCGIVLVCHVARMVIAVSTDHLDTNLTHPSLERTVAFFPALLYTLGVGMGFVVMHRERNETKLRELALVDPLTGCANRRAFELRLASELAHAKRTKSALSMLVVDVDFFKRVNDTHGHPVGDEVIRRVAQILRCGVRTSDVVARMGGEEF